MWYNIKGGQKPANLIRGKREVNIKNSGMFSSYVCPAFYLKLFCVDYIQAIQSDIANYELAIGYNPR